MRGKGLLVISRHRIADTIIPPGRRTHADTRPCGLSTDAVRTASVDPLSVAKIGCTSRYRGFPGDYLDSLHRRCAGVAQQGDGDTNLST